MLAVRLFGWIGKDRHLIRQSPNGTLNTKLTVTNLNVSHPTKGLNCLTREIDAGKQVCCETKLHRPKIASRFAIARKSSY
jgi:hypothetical protein